jgi:hypothetical protein
MSRGVIESAAAEAMARGWAVFPVNGKIPATSHGVLDASTEERFASIWFERHPRRGYAVATGGPSGVWVLDLDGPEAVQRFAELQQEHGAIGNGVASKTARGYHLFFRMPASGDIRNLAGKIAPEIDVRGSGGYVVAPPSPHPEGEAYRWVDGRGPNDTPLTDAPLWLLKLVRAGTTGQYELAGQIPDRIDEGGRNDTLTSLAGSIRRRGGSRAAILAAIQAENETRCSPPLSDDEVESIADSVAQYEPAVASERLNPKHASLSPAHVSANAEPAAFPGPSTAAHLMDQPEPEVQWLARGLIPAGGNVLVAGYPKSYKTTFVEDLAVSLVSGSPFLEKFAVDETHNVGLILMEGIEWQTARRIRRLCNARRENPRELGERIHIWHRPPLKLTNTTVLGLASWVEKLSIDVVILDAWSYVAIGNSNDSDEVTPQLQAFSSIRDTVPDCTVVLVHHARKWKKDGGSRLTDEIRNSGAFGAWYDAGLVLARKDEHSPVTVRCEFRDYPSPEEFTFTVEDEDPANESNGWRSSGYLRLTATDKSIEQIERDARIEDVIPRVRDFVAANNECSKSALRDGVNARGTDVDRAWKHLVMTGEATDIAPTGPFKAAKLSLCVPVSHGVPDTSESQRVPVSLPRRGGPDTQTVTQNPTADVLA